MIVAASEQLERAERYLAGIPGAAERALSNALNKAMAAARDAAIEEISSTYNLSADDIRHKLDVERATPEDLTAGIVMRSRSLSLGYFSHTPTTAGSGGPGRPLLRAEIRRGEPKDVKGAFVATINGQPRVMMRTGKRTAAGKSAIASVYTIPLAGMLGTTPIRAAVEERALAMVDEILGREIDKALAEVA